MGRQYTVSIGGDSVTYCDCWQWKINKTCKHTQDYLANQTKGQAVPPHPVPPKARPDVDPIQEAINEAVATMKGNR